MAKPIPACESHHNSRKQSTSAAALSASEINAAMQLIQLSSADSYSDHQEDDDSSNNSFFSFGKVDAASSSSSLSSSSVAVRLMEAGTEGEDDGDGDRSNFGGRRNKRYRSVVELYRVTNETVLMSVVKANKRRKKKAEMQ